MERYYNTYTSNKEGWKHLINGIYETNYLEEKEFFKGYCGQLIKSINVAIDKKVKGSTVEDEYFLEKAIKLIEFFLQTRL